MPFERLLSVNVVFDVVVTAVPLLTVAGYVDESRRRMTEEKSESIGLVQLRMALEAEAVAEKELGVEGAVVSTRTLPVEATE